MKICEVRVIFTQGWKWNCACFQNLLFHLGKIYSEVFYKITLSKKISTVQAMTFQPFCIGQNSVNSEQISAGKAVLGISKFTFTCVLWNHFLKDTLEKSVYYITYYTICHLVALSSSICNSSWEIVNRIKMCKLSVFCIGIFQTQLYICNEHWNGGREKICVVKLWQVWSVSIVVCCYYSSAFLSVCEWGW